MEIPTTYNPKETEEKWYKFWLENGYFQAESSESKQPFTIVIPPPNVTGVLHMGHALDFTLQDIVIRHKKMQGFDTLWLPGTDHAGIATQAKVESEIKKEGLNRLSLGREKFLEKVWEWKEKSANTIHEQWAKIGFALDYSRERFTMDEGLSRAVRKVFIELYNKGLIYRGKYIINWDPEARTAISDIEVEYKEVKGALYHLRYPLKDGSGFITVATTRPETMLGDTAVAVHHLDERYQDLIGKTVILPIIGREIPIIADHYVDKEFGSGAVKITPAHDPNDFEVGLRHNLPQVLVMDETGHMNQNAGKYQGMERFQCRKQIVEDLKEQGVLIKIEEHIHAVGHSERSGAVVEPYLSTQWFVKMQPLAEKAIELQKSGDGVNFVPERFERTYLTWIENVRDWCISRQLWWGHRIPAWYCEDCGEVHVKEEAPQTCQKCGSSNLKQDEDVLDTWFSSALWPFSTMGWPDETADFKRYYPTDLLVTGYDIIFFWVARMIFTALEFTQKKPFKDVYIHGLIRDAEGRKMSKSLGNGIDPLEVIEKYGADALRFMLATGSTPGQDVRFYWEKVESIRNFANKIWNASRFVLMNLQNFTPSSELPKDNFKRADKWILSRLQETAKDVTRLLAKYEFGEAGRILYNFIWDELCDWYIELAKVALYGNDEKSKNTTQNLLVFVLDHTLRLLHPFMPFLTEEIWQHLPHEGKSIMLAKWPELNEFNYEEEVKELEIVMEVIRVVRNIRAETNVPLSKKVELLIKPENEKTEKLLLMEKAYLDRFCNPEIMKISVDLSVPEQAISQVITKATIYLPLKGLIDIQKELERLQKEEKHYLFEVERVQKKLSNEGFVAKAPQHVIEEERQKEEDYLMKLKKVQERIKELTGLKN